MSFQARLDAFLWSPPSGRFARWQPFWQWPARLVFALTRDFTQGYLSLQAMSLVYTTLLSLVPLLAVAFSVLKGFGVHNQLEPLLLKTLYPLGDQAGEIAARIIGFVDNMRVGVLGSVGLAVLFYTVISLIHKVEQVFNYTWRVNQERPFGQRFSQYLSILLVGPILVFSAVGLSTSIMDHASIAALLQDQSFGSVVKALGTMSPYLAISLTFAFFYMFVPNTRVRLLPALIGALCAGLLWVTIGDVFASVMTVSTRSMAIYSSLAILVLFMIWIYVAWLIVLIGASIAFYVQQPEYLTIRARELRLSNRLRERLALLLAGHIARHHLEGAPPWSGERLSSALGVPRTNVVQLLQMLEASGLLLRVAHERDAYVPARDPDRLPVHELLNAVRCYEERDSGCRGTPPDHAVGRLERQLAQAIERTLAGMTWRELAERLEEPAASWGQVSVPPERNLTLEKPADLR